MFIFLLTMVISELFFMFRTPSTFTEKWSYAEEEVGTTKFDGQMLGGKLNSMGLRDKEYPFYHTSYRILALGDSFTYGFQLKNSNSWPKKAEAFLHADNYIDLEILNGGVPGRDTKVEYYYFEKYSYKYKPDMVIIAFLINDATSLDSNGGAVKLKYKFDELVKQQECNRKFGLYAFNYIRLSYLKRKLIEATVKEYNDPYEHNSMEFQQCKEAFFKFREISKKNDFRLIVVIYPMLYQLNKKYPFMKIHEKMKIFFKQSGIEAYDLTREFYGIRDTDLWISDGDSHPNIRANEIAARKIAEIIKGYLKK